MQVKDSRGTVSRGSGTDESLLQRDRRRLLLMRSIKEGSGACRVGRDVSGKRSLAALLSFPAAGDDLPSERRQAAAEVVEAVNRFFTERKSGWRNTMQPCSGGGARADGDLEYVLRTRAYSELVTRSHSSAAW